MSALFLPLGNDEFTVAATASGSGNVEISPGTTRHPSGRVVAIWATPDPGQEFIGWSGETNSVSNPLILKMDRNWYVGARFTSKPKLTIFSPGLGVDDQAWIRSIGLTGQHHRLESSSDLDAWIQIGEAGHMSGVFLIPVPASTTERNFFRLREVP